MPERTFVIATRGSALALVQANLILDQCRAAFPESKFELRILKTTGDKLQTASMAQGDLPKGLFTKELEVALLEGSADLAVHSLKDLPTELPSGLKLGGVTRREDVRDVVIYRDASQFDASAGFRGFEPKMSLEGFPEGATIATSSTRRVAQLQAARPDFKTIEIRGNVPTRLKKLATQSDMDATVLAHAGMRRLGYEVNEAGHVLGQNVPHGLLATVLDVNVMLPCVGQAAIGIEIRQDDPELVTICERLTDPHTLHAVTAERSFLAAMGGGCQSPVGAHGQVAGNELHLRAVSFLQGCRHAQRSGPLSEAVELGQAIADELR